MRSTDEIAADIASCTTAAEWNALVEEYQKAAEASNKARGASESPWAEYLPREGEFRHTGDYYDGVLYDEELRG